MTAKKLYRSKQDKVIAGVCGGLGEYLDIDAIWIRIVAIILLVNGIGFIMYLLAWILIPLDPRQHDTPNTKAEEFVANFKHKHEKKKKAKESKSGKDTVIDVTPEKKVKKDKGDKGHGAFMFGMVLVLFGTFMILNKLFPLFDSGFIWAAVLFLIGVHFLWKGVHHEN